MDHLDFPTGAVPAGPVSASAVPEVSEVWPVTLRGRSRGFACRCPVPDEGADREGMSDTGEVEAVAQVAASRTDRCPIPRRPGSTSPWKSGFPRSRPVRRVRRCGVGPGVHRLRTHPRQRPYRACGGGVAAPAAGGSPGLRARLSAGDSNAGRPADRRSSPMPRKTVRMVAAISMGGQYARGRPATAGYRPATVIPSIRRVGALTAPLNTRSPAASSPRSMSRRRPAIVTSLTGSASSPLRMA